MNKKLIALAVAGSLAMPMLAHAEAPTVYGKVHLTYGMIQEDAGGVTVVDNWQMDSWASRFGVKGEHDLGGGLSGIYKFEWEVDPFESVDSGLARRNQYAGLKGGWGQLRFGRHDTPLKMSQGKFDQFGDRPYADLKYAGSQDGENRLDNVLAYLGKTGNIKYAVALIPSEGDGTTSGDGPADSISASIAYDSGPLYVALAHDSYDDTGAAAGSSNTLTRLIGTYKMGNMQFGLMYQTGVESVAPEADEEDWLGASFSAKFGSKNKFKAQYIQTEDNAAVTTDGTLMAVAVDHKFGKKVTGYVMYSNVKFEGGSDSEDSFTGAGLVVKF